MTIDAYIDAVPLDRKPYFEKLRHLIQTALPPGFVEVLQNGMLGYVVPHETYPQGYHCNPKDPLPFLSLGSNKGGIVLYHMGLYSMPDLYQWFVDAYTKVSKHKIDVGKSCIKFKYPDEIPFDLLEQLFKTVTVTQWIQHYEATLKP